MLRSDPFPLFSSQSLALTAPLAAFAVNSFSSYLFDAQQQLETVNRSRLKESLHLGARPFFALLSQRTHWRPNVACSSRPIPTFYPSEANFSQSLESLQYKVFDVTVL